MNQEKTDQLGKIEQLIIEYEKERSDSARYVQKIPNNLAGPLAEYQKLRQEHARYILNGEDEKAEELLPRILSLNPKAALAREWSKESGGLQNINEELQQNEQSKAFRIGAKLYEKAEQEQENHLKTISELTDKLAEKKTEVTELLEQLGNSYRALYDLFVKIKKVLEPLKKELPMPPKVPEADKLILDDISAWRAFGQRPFLM
jgi:hypothetical protein